MKILVARICDIGLLENGTLQYNIEERGYTDYCEYTLEIDDSIAYNENLLKHIARGLFFMNDWSCDGTTSYWFVR